MSTKIYNGYRATVGFQEMYKALTRFRSEAVPLFEDKAYLRMTCLAMARYRRKMLDLPISDPDLQANESHLMEAFHMTAERYRDIYATDKRDPAFDFEAIVNVYPLGEETLMTLTLEERVFPEVLKLWESLPVEYYGYWNNTDIPDDISLVEWEDRGLKWDRALGDDKGRWLGPSGLQFKVSGRYVVPVPRREFIEKHLPTVARISGLCESLAVDLLLKRGATLPEPEVTNMSKVFAAIKELQKTQGYYDAVEEVLSIDVTYDRLIGE